MTNFESLKEMSIDQLAEWLDSNNEYDFGIWNKWFTETYCDHCDPIICKLDYLDREAECSFCEANQYCRFFENSEEVPWGADLVKLWLMQEVSNEG